MKTFLACLLSLSLSASAQTVVVGNRGIVSRPETAVETVARNISGATSALELDAAAAIVISRTAAFIAVRDDLAAKFNVTITKPEDLRGQMDNILAAVDAKLAKCSTDAQRFQVTLDALKLLFKFTVLIDRSK